MGSSIEDAITYEIALSFADEQREYVAQVASLLEAAGVRVFYDQYEQASLWGKDLFVHLSDVYQKASKYTLIFVSAAYASKLWTNHERKSAQARAFATKSEYILPARFDDTEIPGLLPTVGHIDLRTTSPEQLADLVLVKLGRKPSTRRNDVPSLTDVLDLIAAAQSRGSSVAETVAQALRVARSRELADLERFCLNELMGYSNDREEEYRAAQSFRSVKFQCSPAELSTEGMSLAGLTLKSAIAVNRELFIERSIVVPEPIGAIESRLAKRDDRGFWHLRLPVGLFTKEADDPRVVIHCYAEADSFVALVESVRAELTRLLAQVLVAGKV